jgi:hypothetical protein
MDNNIREQNNRARLNIYIIYINRQTTSKGTCRHEEINIECVGKKNIGVFFFLDEYQGNMVIKKLMLALKEYFSFYDRQFLFSKTDGRDNQT